MNLSCYILDDEYHAVNILKNFIQKTPGLDFAGSSTSPLHALREINQISPDVIFLDIDMPDITGLQVAEILTAKYKIIFTTAYKEYAAEAFEKDAIDYLLKPISYERFLHCIFKVRSAAPDPNDSKISTPDCFYVKAGTKSNFTKVTMKDIQYITGSGNYIEIYMNGKKVLTYLTLNEITEKLPPAIFSRIHKSHIVNHQFILSFDYSHVKLAETMFLPIGRAYRAAFKKKMDQTLLISKRDETI